MRKYPYEPKNPRTQTDFEQKWGITARELAESEGVTVDSIHMRVMKFGSPFQRKRAPTICEIMTGKTLIELATELGVTPCTISMRLVKYGTPYETLCNKGTGNKGAQRAEKHWTQTRSAGVTVGTKQGWLHPDHPDYHTWRYQFVKTHCPTTNNVSPRGENK